MRKRLGLILVLVGICSAASAAAEQCTNAMLRGAYGFQTLSFVVPPSGGIATPRTAIGVFTLDGKGKWTTSLTVNDNGVITHPPPAASVGTYTVNPDCTGTLYIGSGGTVAIVVVDGGREFFQMRTDPANVVSFGTTKQISRGNGDTE